MSKEKKYLISEELRTSLLRELAPEEYEVMVKNGEVLADKYPDLMHGGSEPRLIPAFVIGAVVGSTIGSTVGSVVGTIVSNRLRD